MTSHEDYDIPRLEERLEKSTIAIWEAAQEFKGDSLALLAILRALEGLHREIRDTLFQESLPDNRQSLYKLLRDIEARGGWPYIYRMKARELLENLTPETEQDLDQSSARSHPPISPEF
jgi:hypothetical protein